MSSFSGYETNPEPTTDGDHVMWMKGCDGVMHAIRRDSITYEDGEPVAGVPISTEIIGACDGSCHGQLMERGGFIYDA